MAEFLGTGTPGPFPVAPLILACVESIMQCPVAPKAVKLPSTQLPVGTPKTSVRGSAKRLALDTFDQCDFNDVYSCSTLDEILSLVRKLVVDNAELRKELADVKKLLLDVPRPSSIGSCQADKVSYASVTRGSKNVVVIKPTSKVNNPEESLKLIKTKLKPADYKLCGVSNTKQGGVVVQCPTSAELNKFKTDAASRLGNDFEVTAPLGRRPRVRVFGFSIEYNAIDLVKVLKEQNDDVISETSHITVAHIYQGKSCSRFGAKLVVDADTFKRMIEAGKISIGWDPCWVSEDINIRRCFKCWGFNHVASKCLQPHQLCPKCSGNHHQKDCDSTIEKCVVCCVAVAKRHIKIDTDHTVFSSSCPSYAHRLAQEHRYIDYGQ